MNSLLVIELRILNELRYGLDRGRKRVYELCREYVAEYEATTRDTVPSIHPVMPESDSTNV